MISYLRPVVMLLAIGLMAFGQSSWACYGIEKSDAPMLPKYCTLWCVQKDGRSSAGAQRWTQILTRDVTMHIHHYCSGINFARKAQGATSRKKKKATSVQAMNNYEYVLKRWPENSKLYPELLTRVGQLMETMDRDIEAAQYYQNAIRIKPNYVPAYALYSDWSVKAGNKQDAIELLKQGLAQAPNSPPLVRRLKALK